MMLDCDGIGSLAEIVGQPLEQDRSQIVGAKHCPVLIGDTDRRPINLKTPVAGRFPGSAGRFAVQGAGDQDLARNIECHGAA